LVWSEERLRQIAVAAELEGSEILKPGAIRDFWIRLYPEHELSEVFFGDVPVVHATNQMLSDRQRKIEPAYFGHSLAKNHAAQLIA
jgi:hypothetical protein